MVVCVYKMLIVTLTTFETHTKTAEPVEMPFGMTRVRLRYRVLRGGPDLEGEGAILWKT